jgi:hypothetical protein
MYELCVDYECHKRYLDTVPTHEDMKRHVVYKMTILKILSLTVKVK